MGTIHHRGYGLNSLPHDRFACPLTEVVDIAVVSRFMNNLF
jgi:hypothetical protein